MILAQNMTFMTDTGDQNILNVALKNSLLLLAVVNPVGNIPVYADLTRKLARAEQSHVMNMAVLTALMIVVTFALIGDWCLVNLFGVTLMELKVAGGILLFIVALKGVMPRKNGGLLAEDADNRLLAVFPIAFPIMVGPGTITVTIIMSQGLGRMTMLLIAAVTFVFVYLIARNADRLMKITGPYVGFIIARLLYIFLATKAVAMFMSGATEYIWKVLSTIS